MGREVRDTSGRSIREGDGFECEKCLWDDSIVCFLPLMCWELTTIDN